MLGLWSLVTKSELGATSCPCCMLYGWCLSAALTTEHCSSSSSLDCWPLFWAGLVSLGDCSLY